MQYKTVVIICTLLFVLRMSKQQGKDSELHWAPTCKLSLLNSNWLQKTRTVKQFTCILDCFKACNEVCSKKRNYSSSYEENVPVQLKSGRYIFFKQQISRQDAIMECSKNGMSLVSLETVEEAKVIFRYIAKLFGKSKEFQYWTSATSLIKRKTYRWNTNGSEVLQELWHRSEPNDRASFPERCVIVGRTVQYHNDYNVALSDGTCDFSFSKISALCEQLRNKSIS